MLTKILPLRGTNGSIVGAVEVFTDCRDLREIQRRVEDLEKLAYLDTTTGIANRRYGEIQLERALSELRLLDLSYGVFFIRFGQIQRGQRYPRAPGGRFRSQDGRPDLDQLVETR